jgi:hypothetical protein
VSLASDEDVSFALLQRFQDNGYTALRGKWLLHESVVRILAKTFPTAVEFAAYVGSLCAPLDSGIVRDFKFTVADITSAKAVDGMVKKIHAGTDGSGVIDSTLSEYPVLIRIYGPDSALFAKGVLFPQEGVYDKEGAPTAILDWLQVKGAHKEWAKGRSGMATGAFNAEGVLVDSALLQEAPSPDNCYKGSLQRWDRPGSIKCAFPFLERVKPSKETKLILLNSIASYIEEFDAAGGVNGILANKAGSDGNFQLVQALCQKLGVNPLAVPFVRTYVEENISRKLYHLSQGAGISTQRYVIRHDAGVPVGSAVIRIFRSDGTRVLHGESIAVSRFPILLPNALKEFTVCDPRVEEYSHLSHLLIRGDAVKHVIAINPADSTDMQADDDGDTTLVSPEEDLLTLVRSRYSFFEDRPEARFLIEPGKLSGNPKGRIPTLDPRTGRPSAEALRIIAYNTQGPVGMLTYYCSVFISLGMNMHALACAVAVQEAIDGGKHAIMLSDLDLLCDRTNWEEVEPDLFKPHGCEADINGDWYDATGSLNIDTLRKWVATQTAPYSEGEKGITIKEALPWRVEGKRVLESEWRPPSGKTDDLVNYSNYCASVLWDAYRSSQRAEEVFDNVDLAGLVAQASGLPISNYAMNPNSIAYKQLYKKSGMYNHLDQLRKIFNQPIDSEERNLKINEQKVILADSLRKVSSNDLLRIFATEVAQANTSEKWKKHVNNAFRVIAFTGSPILDALGIEEEGGCSFLTAGMLSEHFGHLLSQVEEGVYPSLIAGVLDWRASFDEIHQLETGTSALELTKVQCSK